MKSILKKIYYSIFDLRHNKFYVDHNNWFERINNVVKCRDNNKIIRVNNAGKIVSGYLIMHNGIKINHLSYYGESLKELLEKNRGVHEPQEEFIFQEVLKEGIRDGAVMLELGSYWAFYSMWFYREVKNAQCHMIEANQKSL